MFSDDDDRDNLFELAAALSFKMKTECSARALMLCQAHFLLRTGAGSLPAMIRRLLQRHEFFVKVIEMREMYVFCNIRGALIKRSFSLPFRWVGGRRSWSPRYGR